MREGLLDKVSIMGPLWTEPNCAQLTWSDVIVVRCGEEARRVPVVVESGAQKPNVCGFSASTFSFVWRESSSFELTK